VTPRHAGAIGLWLLAWFFAGLIPASLFAAKDGERALARRELAAGLIGTAALACAGVLLW
jgi:hypothetical protein